jgi:hypothetical protein
LRIKFFLESEFSEAVFFFSAGLRLTLHPPFHPMHNLMEWSLEIGCNRPDTDGGRIQNASECHAPLG